jgi:predicted SprT family Zn-dependent metalloprotease
MDDLISRQDAIDALYKMLHDYFWADDKELDAVIMTLNDMPSAQPKRKKGKWMAQKGGGYRCSECKHYALDERDGNLVHVSAKTKFCPYCGAEMEKNDGKDK